MSKRIEVNQGDRYNKLTIVKEVFTKSRRAFLCRCDCGNETEVILNNLRTGNVTSCGCYHKEVKTTHGLSSHPLCSVWHGMKRRCYSKKDDHYYNYGGRGITVCDEWLNDLNSFIEWGLSNGYKKGLEIDRIDNNKGYSPDNCRFLTKVSNLFNKRVQGKVRYRGVSFYESRDKYKSRVAIGNGKEKFIGYFDTAIEAARAYDKYIIANNLPNKLNFEN